MHRPTAFAAAMLIFGARRVVAEGERWLQLAQAQPSRGGVLDWPARLDVRDIPLVKALQELSSHSRVALVYSPSLLPKDVAVSCACAASTTRHALLEILAATAFTFYEADGQVVLVPSPPRVTNVTRTASGETSWPLMAESPLSKTRTDHPRPPPDSATVIGRVTSDGGVAIGNAIVTAPGSGRSVTTNDAGLFRLVVPLRSDAISTSTAGDTLHVVRLGYRPATVELPTSAREVTVDVTMSAQAVALDRIVVTGTAGNQERRAQSAVVATIDAADVMAKTAMFDVNEIMYSQSPGVSMTIASGTSGANTRIDIRGQSSISLTNYPLVFVDGVRVTAGPRGTTGTAVGGQSLNALDDLNPNDVQSIEIVKGPAAATLYGADASTGVIQILTKRGRVGARRFSQTVSTDYATVDPNFTPYDNYATCTTALVSDGSTNPLCKGKPAGTVVSDNVLLRNHVFAPGRSGSLVYSAQGGGDTYGYYGSFEGSDERGTTPANFLNRRRGRVNFSWSANPRISVDANIGLMRSDDQLPKGDQDIYGFLVAGDMGSPASVATTAGSLAGGWFQPTESVASISAINTEDVTLRLTPSMQLRIAPVSWFTNRLTLGEDVATTSASQVYQKNALDWYSAVQNAGQVSITESNVTMYTVDYLGNISGRFGKRAWLSSDFSFGSQWVNSTSASLIGLGQGLITNSSALIGSATTTAGSQTYAQSKSLGFFGQEQIGLNDRLYLQLAARVDRNSAFGARAGTFFLPKAGLSWVASQESFWQRHLAALSTFRVRAAYGTTGRSPNSAAALQTFSKANYVTDSGVVLPGITPGSPGNPKLRPERGSELETGFDAGAFDDRLGIEATYFDKRSRDLLLALPIAPSSGYAASPLVNIGEVSNKGVELSLRAALVARRNLTWDLGATTNTLTNRVVSMGSVTPFVTANNQCIKPGVEIGAWCVPRVLSVDTVTHRTIVTDTAVNVGGQLPKYEASLNSSVTIRGNLRLYVQFDGKFDYRIYDLTKDFRDRNAKNSAEVNLAAGEGGYSAYELQERLGPFVAQNAGTPVGATLVRDSYIVPGDFVRLREVSATWTLPTSLAKHLGVSGSSLTVGGRNLWLSSRYPGWDPEVNGADVQVFLGRADVFTTPQTRRVFARISVLP